MRIIDAEDYLYRERPVGLSDELYQESHLYKSIMEQEVIQAIPLDDVKKARDEIENYNVLNNFALNTETFKVGVTRGLDLAVEILDKLIAESEEQHG